MQIKYHHIGNTSLRTNALLYNFEKQLKLLSKLFENAAEGDTWANGSSLQQKYMQLLIDNGLLNTTTEVKIGTKNARVKSVNNEAFAIVFYKIAFKNRIMLNIKDFTDLNKRYLLLTLTFTTQQGSKWYKNEVSAAFI